MRMQVTFWIGSFSADAYEKLIKRLKTLSLKGEGFWYMTKPNYVRAYITEADYEWIMSNIAD